MATDLQIGQWYYLRWVSLDVKQGKLMSFNSDRAVFRVYGYGLLHLRIDDILGMCEQPHRGFWRRLFYGKDGE